MKKYNMSLLLALLFAGCGGGSGGSEGDTSHSSDKLTLAQCKAVYGKYTNMQWAQTQAFADLKSEAAACYQALVAGPSMGIHGQLYIDAYNRGEYNVLDRNKQANNKASTNGAKNPRLTLEYIKNNPNKKLSSQDCATYKAGHTDAIKGWVGGKIQISDKGLQGWGDFETALQYDLAPSTNIMKSIRECIWIQHAVESGKFSYAEAVSINKRHNPNIFSDG